MDSLIKKFKPEFLKRKIYSSTSVLYHSTVFSTSLDLIEDTEEFVEQHTSDTASIPQYNMPKIGRNDPCPCGSGKKYKNCCMLKN